MLYRWLQVLAVTVYIVVAIGCVAYLGLSVLWLAPLVAPALYYVYRFEDLTLPQATVVYPLPAEPAVDWQMRIDQRLEELKNGPAHRNKPKYIDAISRGIPYSDERIDYLEFPDRLVLCEHLRPLEAAMRAAKLPMDNYRPGDVEVSCIMNVARIQKRLSLADCVRFTLAPGPDNHAPDITVVRCLRCDHSIGESLYGGPWPEA